MSVDNVSLSLSLPVSLRRPACVYLFCFIFPSYIDGNTRISAGFGQTLVGKGEDRLREGEDGRKGTTTAGGGEEIEGGEGTSRGGEEYAETRDWQSTEWTGRQDCGI